MRGGTSVDSENSSAPRLRALMQTVVVCEDPRSYHRIIFYVHLKQRALWQMLVEKHTTYTRGKFTGRKSDMVMPL